MSATWTNPTDRTQGDLISASDWNNLIGEDGSLDYANNLRGRKNYIINGNFDIWQRGSSFSHTSGYTSDRWNTAATGGTIAVDRTAFTLGQTDVPNNPSFYADVEVTGSVTDQAFIEQRIENVQTLAGDTVTLSFWAKYTTNQPSTSLFKLRFVQVFGSGGSSAVASISDGITLTTSWQKFTYTVTLPSVSGKTLGTNPYLIVRFGTSDAETTYDFQIAQVQVEKGNKDTDFEIRPIAEEQVLCDRYFQSYGNTGNTYIIYSFGVAINTTECRTLFNFRNIMRTTPSMTYSGAFQISGQNTKSISSFSFLRGTLSHGELNAAGSGFTSNNTYFLRSFNDVDAVIKLDAEL